MKGGKVETIRCFPLSLKPALSYKGLLKGEIRLPKEREERVYLTDVGEAILKCIRKEGGWIKLNEGEGYLPRKMTFNCGNLKGIMTYTRLGPSSYHTLIDIHLIGRKSDVNSFRKFFLQTLGRNPSISPFFAHHLQSSQTNPTAHLSPQNRL